MRLFFSNSNVRSPSRRQCRLAAQIIKRSESLRSHSDKQLRELFLSLRDLHLRDGAPDLRDSTLLQSFACVREASRRTTGMSHYDVQIIAGLELVRGRVAQMATGEGKTLAATLAAATHGLFSGNTHVMTVNAYLAERDYQITRPVYQALGLSCGLITTGQDASEKRQAYACDITYGTGPEFGFDYLRDQMALLAQPEQPSGHIFRRRLHGLSDNSPKATQREHRFALVDEADSVLIDEAGSALIISGSSGRPNEWPNLYTQAEDIARQLIETEHFILDEANRHCQITEQGLDALTDLSGNISHLRLSRPWYAYVTQALRARYLFHRDVDYVVVDDVIQIVDEFTGRRFEDRHWNGGLHQAVEASESVTITEESESVMRISRQRYLSFYDRIAGMTGTAQGCDEELWQVFKLTTCAIPRHKDNLHQVLAPRFFATMEDKLEALIDEVKHRHQQGQPVLIGTLTVKDSEYISTLLQQRGLNPRVLNALQDQQESDVICSAGHLGAITIATNMAGRGSDIPLGPGVAQCGGLFVIVAEPNKSARIDRQLTGRSARQGDPGASRLYMSADDAIVRRHAEPLRVSMQQAMTRGERATGHDSQLQHDFSGDLRELQHKLETLSRESRRDLVQRDEWLQRILERAV